jgi:hypothetical protein
MKTIGREKVGEFDKKIRKMNFSTKNDKRREAGGRLTVSVW